MLYTRIKMTERRIGKTEKEQKNFELMKGLRSYEANLQVLACW